MKTKEKKCKCEIKYASDGKVRFWKTDCPIHTKSEVWLNKSPKPKEKKVRIEEIVFTTLGGKFYKPLIGPNKHEVFRYGSEIINHLARKINEVIKVINSK